MRAAGDRVLVRPGTDDAEMVGTHPPMGTVRAFSTDEDRPHLMIELDDGATIWSRSPDDWTVLPPDSETR